MEKTSAKSILEFLTTENCRVENQKPHSVNLTGRYSYQPQELKEWDEFSIQTMEEIYDGKLMEEARKKDCDDLFFPVLDPLDCTVNEETGTVNVLTKWTHTIVTRALRAVEKTLHPSIWVAKTGSINSIERNTTAKKKNKQASIPVTRLKPDAGAVAACKNSPPVERLPKEYKTASKWNSAQCIAQNLNENGEWMQSAARNNYVMPIRQIYTYCITLGCRYGCIISTTEAFIFRIGPRTAEPGETGR